MSGKIGKALGTSGEITEINYLNYTGIAYTSEDYHQPICVLSGETNATEVRVCGLLRLPDLNQTRISVKKNEHFLNHLIDLGVAGFRVDAFPFRFIIIMMISLKKNKLCIYRSWSSYGIFVFLWCR